MSTIEEAREQARKLDEPLRQAGNRAAYYRTGELELIEATRRTLRALLDATEPPRAAVCEWCPASARGTAWHNDGRLHLSCGQIDHGQGWVPDEPAAILATDLATEPPVIQYADSATVAGLAEKIAGENAELMERLAVKPANETGEDG